MGGASLRVRGALVKDRGLAALSRVKRRMSRALAPDDVPITLSEAAALVGMSRSWMRRRLLQLHLDGGGVLWDARRSGATKPHWKTTPRCVRAALSARRRDPETREEIETALEDLRARVHRLEVLQALHTERLAELAPTG